MTALRMVAALPLLAALPAHAAPIPDAIADMLRAADADDLKTVAKVAKRAAPDSTEEISALVKDIEDAREAQRVAEIAEQSFLQGWSGEGALGGSISTGNTDEIGASASLALGKRGLDWEHDLKLSFDYLQTNDVVRRERFYAGYTGRYDLSGDFFFSFGLLSFERDRFSGIEHRFTESLGVGYRLADSPDFKWTVEGGPALRQTGFTNGEDENKLDILGRTEVSWKPADGLTLSETAGALVSTNGGNSSLYSRSAVTAKIVGNLSGRLSFDVMHETDPPAGRDKTDTISRASIVYGF